MDRFDPSQVLFKGLRNNVLKKKNIYHVSDEVGEREAIPNIFETIGNIEKNVSDKGFYKRGRC